MANDGDSTKLSRGDWVNACEFHPLEQGKVLQQVIELVAEKSARARGPETRPMVLLDLDSTLYEVSPRTMTILQELKDHPELELPKKLRDALNSLRLEGIGYSIPDTFNLHGVPVEQDPDLLRAIPKMRELWKERFFSDPYLAFDRPYPGAAEYVRKLHELGAEIVYLTGREAARMKEGTKANLTRDGFPWGSPRTHLWMKENSQWDDLHHKQMTAQSLRNLGIPVASFENEPRNIVGFMEIFPEAMHIFVETVCSELPAQICQGLYRIRDFSL